MIGAERLAMPHEIDDDLMIQIKVLEVPGSERRRIASDLARRAFARLDRIARRRIVPHFLRRSDGELVTLEFVNGPELKTGEDSTGANFRASDPT